MFAAQRTRLAWPGLHELFALRDFRWLLVVRLVGQAGDGLLQVGLASYVFFSPERAATPERVALGFALLLLPFSLVGPFAGVLLDRWSRRQVLLIANLVRSAVILTLAIVVSAGAATWLLFAIALIALGLNRFVIAALGAALPHVVPTENLVIANAVAPTAGTAMTFTGAGVGVVISSALGGSDHADGAVMVLASVACVGAALCVLRLQRGALGPDAVVRIDVHRAVADVLRGVVAGVRHLRDRTFAARALLVMAAHRMLFGALTVMTIVLFRNTFFPGAPQQALKALGVSLAVGGAGAVLGAVLTPWATRHLGSRRWMSGLLFLAALVAIAVLPSFREGTYLAAAGAVGLTAQGLKVSIDTILQADIDDAYRGRVFTIYDVVFNVTFVLAGLVTAVIVPIDGESLPVVVVVALGYAATGLWYRRAS